MKREYFNTEKDGFYGAYFRNPKHCSKGVILMLGDRIDDLMVKMGVKWLHRNGCNVLTMASDTKDYAYHDYPIESYEKATEVMRAKGNAKFGIIGASTTALYYTSLKIVRDQGQGIGAQFFRSFRENFRQATVLWLILLGAGLFLGADIYLVWHLRAAAGGTLAVLWTLCLALLITSLAMAPCFRKSLPELEWLVSTISAGFLRPFSA